ncbi:ribonuclease P protein component [Rubricella aquisinus]|uniref:Ribonuclease P protein component n=1 Tax=Rubricella aquisinus TaxID=2028108 RepID=A0A840X108_9RHOB|nr:ribonuclease P protein component [Rubricella aquisinus]MBB5517060.1 ribonuclease P protein component [Rubricella aquisinus]
MNETPEPDDPSAAGSLLPLSRADVSPLPNRRDFLAAARARKQAMPGLVLQARRRGADEPSSSAIRLGLTCSKKVGNAVLRNRARRRLRAAAMIALPSFGKAGWDYVLIGRRDVTVARSFDDLVADVETALGRIHTPRKPRP